MLDAAERFLCIASSEKGHDFLRQCADMGVEVTLLTLEKLRDAQWPRESLEDLVTMPSGLNHEQILNTVSWMARGKRFDRVAALDENDIAIAAVIREHMRVPGMGSTTAACYRDKLANRVIARALGFAVPDFCRVLNYDELRDYMARVPPPWLLMPRWHASALQVRRIEQPEQFWRILDDLGDLQSHYLLDQFMPGEIFSVDSLISESEVKFQQALQGSRQLTPAASGSSVSTIRTVDAESREAAELAAMNSNLAPAFGMVRGITHARFMRAQADGRMYFLDIAARVGDFPMPGLIEVATGINLWREWARLEVSSLRYQPYSAPDSFETNAGVAFSCAQGANLDVNEFEAPEIAGRFKSDRYTGVIVRSGNLDRVRELLRQISAGLAAQLLAQLPPSDRAASS